jgi:hypothetical protein
LVQSFRIEAHYHFVVDHHGWCGTTAIFINQVADGNGMKLDVPLLVFDSSSREVGLKPFARGSAGLGEYDDFSGHGM